MKEKYAILYDENIMLKELFGEMLVTRASRFAEVKHIDHKRKYTGEPYWNHLQEVAELVKAHGASYEVQAAAYLHDTVEDTHTTNEEIMYHFGFRIADLVDQVTDRSAVLLHKSGDNWYDDDGLLVNRAVRKEMDMRWLAQSDSEGATIKLADFVSNTKSIVACDPHFAKVYLREKALVLPYLWHGNHDLYKLAKKNIHG